MKIIFLFFLLFLMINSCAKEDPDEKNKSFEEKITGTFKLKSFKIKEIDNSSSSEFEYTVNHMSTDNYSYFGNTINQENDLFIRTLFGKVNLTSSGRSLEALLNDSRFSFNWLIDSTPISIRLPFEW